MSNKGTAAANGLPPRNRYMPRPLANSYDLDLRALTITRVDRGIIESLIGRFESLRLGAIFPFSRNDGDMRRTVAMRNAVLNTDGDLGNGKEMGESGSGHPRSNSGSYSSASGV